jgi:DNA-directed RNA polymerase specialized sigma24 family protein
MAGSSLVAGVETLSDTRTDAEVDFAGWVNDYQRPLLAFAQLVAGDRQTGEDLLQVALARAYLK